MIKIRISRAKPAMVDDCGCGNPCLEEAEIEISDEKREKLVDKITSAAQAGSDAEQEEFLGKNLEEDSLQEHYAIVDQHFDIYEAVQDAIDENNEAPCPECLYEMLSDATCGCPDLIPEAEYRGNKVTLNKPMRGDVKKSKVYVKNAKGNVVKVNFGDKNMKIKKSNPKRRKSFRARHKCKTPGPKWKARYWSCKAW